MTTPKPVGAAAAGKKVNRINPELATYRGGKTTLCAGCGHNAISERIVEPYFEMGVPPERVIKLSGIGCSSKSPAYFLGGSHGFNSVHGRMPAVATGAVLGNRHLLPIGVSGDGSIVQAEEGAIGGVKSAEVTVLFADLAGFTALSEALSPEDVSAILEGYFTHAVEAIFEEGGTLDKFIGDCVMAFFGAPVAQPDHAKRAVRAAIKILRELDAWNEVRAAKDQPTLSMRIAINTGPVVVGDVGSNKRVDYTVLGNTVNVAARLEAYVGDATEITIGAETNRQLGGAFPTESLGEFQLKGLQKKIEAFRVIREKAS